MVLVDGAPESGPPIDVLRRVTDLGRVAPVDDLPPFCGGAMGYLGYDAVRLVEAIPASGRDEGGLPDAWFGLYDSVVALDRARQRLQLVVLARIDGEPEAAWRAALVAGRKPPRGADFGCRGAAAAHAADAGWRCLVGVAVDPVRRRLSCGGGDGA